MRIGQVAAKATTNRCARDAEGPEEQDRQWNECDGRNRAQELDHDRCPVVQRPRGTDQNARSDADHDGDSEPLEIRLERHADLAGERPLRELVVEGAERRRRRGDALLVFERADSGLYEQRHEHYE